MSIKLNENQCKYVFDILEILQGNTLRETTEILNVVNSQITKQYKDAIPKEFYKLEKKEFAESLFKELNH